MFKKRIKIPIYFGELHIIQSDSLEEVIEEFGLEDLPAFEAVVLPKPLENGYTRYFMIFNMSVTPKIIAHECIHVVNNIFHDRGIKLDLLNDEPQAYLVGWVVEQCHKYLKLNKNE